MISQIRCPKNGPAAAAKPSESGHRALGATVGAVWCDLLAAYKTLPPISPSPPAPALCRRPRIFSTFSSCDSLLTSTWSGPSWAPPDVLLGYSWRHFYCSWSTLDCYLRTSQRVHESTGPRVHGSTGLRVNGSTSHGPRDRARWPVRGAAPVR